ncbi:MAG: hypothetical protein J6386_06495 [Candidatus Synoicihabitans palmerolidicus]|nr:hypothetical protein [Candidatus Synoicihabitans palmerolidicus]
MACRPNRQIRGVADVLGAISVLLTEPEPIDIILVAPPLDVFTSGEFGKQLRRICPGASLALLEAFPEPEDCAPFHEIYDRPDDADRLERLICLLSEERLTTKSR